MANPSVSLTKTDLTLGRKVKCQFQGEEVEGQVAALGSGGVLMMHSKPSNGKSGFIDVTLVNMDCIDRITAADRPPLPLPLPVLDVIKLDKRRRRNVAYKKAVFRAYAKSDGDVKLSPEARNLFLAILKTIDINEVAWEGDKIVVLQKVKISPPYEVKNVEGGLEASVILVKKIVDKFWKEQVGSKR